jgi:RecT family
MSQQPQEQQHTGGLAVYSPNSALLAPLRAPQVRQQITVLLDPLKTPLTYERLLIDLAAYLTANPDVAAKARAPGLYNCMLTAARYQTSFGDGGLWIIPYGGDVAPQESEKFIVQRAKEDAGVERIETVRVHEPDKPVRVQRDAVGTITAFLLNAQADLTAERTEANLVGIFGVAHFTHRADMPEPFPAIRWYDLADLKRRRDHSIAFQKGSSPMWKKDPLQGFERSVRAALARELTPIRTRVPGMVGALVPPEEAGGVIKDITPQAPARDLASELNARAEIESPLDAALRMIGACATQETLDALKASEEFRKLYHACGLAERSKVADAGKSRAYALAQAITENPAGAETANPAPSAAEPEEGAEGSGAGTDQESLTEPPPFPDLSKQVQAVLANADCTVLKGIHDEIRDHWRGLHQDPAAVMELIRGRQKEWGKLLSKATEAEGHAYTWYKKAVLEALQKAGLPFEV